MNRILSNRQLGHRLASNKVFEYVIVFFAFLITLPLFAIIFYVIEKGISKLSWQFLTNIPQPVGEIGGGIANALVGSIILVLLASVIAVPFGILCGVYLAENKNSKLAYWSRLAVDVLQGTPSIVIGIVIYFWVVKPSGSFSGLSGSIALAIMMLPIIIRSTEENVKLLPESLKEAGYALGLPYHKVILKVILPCGFSGILSGVILATARILGETAPLLFTAFGNPYLTTNVLKPMQSLPLIIFNYAMSPYDEWHGLAWGASMILLIWVLLLNILTKFVTRKWKVQL
ncbi:MAG: phosphate ABC transporter permease PstA [Candidatus Dadabacteria bacterium]